MTSPVPGDPNFAAREAAFNDWRSNVILGPLDNHGEDVAHEAFCAGYEASAASPVPVPPEAITAAAEAADEWGHRLTRADAERILEAAAPHLAAAEREACAQLAEQVGAFYPDPRPCEETHCAHEEQPFAALLREARP